MPGSEACVKESCFFKEWHPPIRHLQPFSLVRGSRNIIPYNSVLVLYFPKLPVGDAVSSDEAAFSPALKNVLHFQHLGGKSDFHLTAPGPAWADLGKAWDFFSTGVAGP